MAWRTVFLFARNPKGSKLESIQGPNKQTMASHQEIEARSLRMHQSIAERLRAHPELLEKAKQTLLRYRVRHGQIRWVTEWESILAKPLSDITAFIVSESEKARELRQSTPFVGILSPRERWKFYKPHDASRA